MTGARKYEEWEAWGPGKKTVVRVWIGLLIVLVWPISPFLTLYVFFKPIAVGVKDGACEGWWEVVNGLKQLPRFSKWAWWYAYFGNPTDADRMTEGRGE